ncbi:MAG: PD-(D/E)XK nuclease family protein [Candidatus Magnetoovum sp. WYHC-5]|nr:PD-(D/E)XK nuclease family protein [Candidatus Magnetoovum sp. WYHC-5]
MSVRVIAAGDDIIQEVITHMDITSPYLSNYMIVFPGKRPTHFLAKELGQRIGQAYEAPSLFSMDGFIDYLYETVLKRYATKLELPDVVAILYELQRKAKNPVGGEKFLKIENFFQVAIQLFNDLETLCIEDVSVGRLKLSDVALVDGMPENSAKALERLSFFYEEFYTTIKQMGFSTKASRYLEVSKNVSDIDLSILKGIIFAGFFELTKSEQVLFRELMTLSYTTFLFQYGNGLEDTFKAIGINNQHELPKPQGLPFVNFYKSPDTHGQVFALSEIIKTSGSDNLADDTVIVLLSPDTLFPLYNQTLSLIEKNRFNISIGYPLQRTPIYGFYTSLMELVGSMEDGRFYTKDYLKLVLHPYVKNIFFLNRSDVTRIMFHTIEEILINNKQMFLTLRALQEDDDIFNKIMEKLSSAGIPATKEAIKTHLHSIHEQIIVQFQTFKDIAELATKAMDVLQYINDKSTANYHYFFYPFMEKFMGDLFVLKTSLLAKESLSSIPAYFNLFKKYIKTCRVPFEGMPLRGLQVLGFIETRNIRFKHVFILDLNDDVLPGTKKEGSFLPFKLRKALKVPTYLDIEKRINYYFSLLINGAEDISIFYIENDKKEKSRLVESLLWKIQKANQPIDIHSIQYNMEIKRYSPVPIAKTPEIMAVLMKEMKYSATSVDTYLTCQLKFYYRYVLKLIKREELSKDTQKADVGLLVHKAISRYFENKINYRLNKAALPIKEMEHVVDSLFTEEPIGAQYLLKNQIKKRLIDFLIKYFIPLVEQNQVIIKNIEQPINITIDRFDLFGRIDKIMELNGKYCIIDYKTTSDRNYLSINYKTLTLQDRNSWRKSIPTLQLPFYILLSRGLIPNAMFILLGRQEISEKIEVKLFNDDMDPHAGYNMLKEIILSLLNEIYDESIAFSQSEDLKKTCPTCDYRYICG